MRDLAERLPPDGLVHAAGITIPQSLEHTTEADLRRTFTGKAQGARVLDRVLQGRDLQAWLLFSSVAATWGSAELLAYAAANGLLDGLAAVWRRRGRRATAVAWGPWAGGGMVDDARARAGCSAPG